MRALLLVLLAAAPTGPLSPAPPASGPATGWTSVSWREGATERTAWVSPETLAELRPDGEGARAVRAADPRATVRCPRPRVCLWTVADARAVLRALPASRFVAVLHDGPTTAAPMRVAVGGVAVAVEPGVEGASWLAARGLSVERWLASDLALVATEPGVPALELATRLSAEGVSLAAPNWWRPGVAR